MRGLGLYGVRCGIRHRRRRRDGSSCSGQDVRGSILPSCFLPVRSPVALFLNPLNVACAMNASSAVGAATVLPTPAALGRLAPKGTNPQARMNRCNAEFPTSVIECG
jgi:hypothetical protein